MKCFKMCFQEWWAKPSTCLEEPLIPSSASSTKKLEAAFKNYYRVQNVVLGLGMINILLTWFIYHNHPTVKKIALYSSLIFQSMTVLSYLFYTTAIIVESAYGDHHVQVRRKFLFKLWGMFGVVSTMFCVYETLVLYNSTPLRGTFWEILRLFDIHVYMSGIIQMLWLCAVLVMVKKIRYNTVNNKHRATTKCSEVAAGGVPTTYNVAGKDEKDLKDCPV